jgi:PAS domain S-box-containing protein
MLEVSFAAAPGLGGTSFAMLPSGEFADISFFTNVFHDSAVPAVIIGPDSAVLFWNSAAQRLFGWSSEEVLGRPLPLIPPDGLDEHLLLRQRTLDGQGFSLHRLQRLHKDGTPIELSLSTWPIRGTDGRAVAMVGIYTDVGAEQLRFRQSLANQQLEELERLYATAPIGLAFFDTDLRYVRVNERLAQIDGLPVEAHIGMRLADVVPEVAATMEVVYRDVIAAGVSVIEHELRAPTPALPGVQRDWQVSAYPLKHPDGTVLGVTVVVTDITERKRLNEELKRQEMLLRLVIDGIPGLVVYIDSDYRYRFANRAYGEWFQRPLSEFEGQKVEEALGPAAFEQVRERVDRALAGEHVEYERRIRYADRERDVRLNYVPDRGPDGVVRGIVALAQDVTGQKRAEQALRESEERFRRIVEIAAEGIWIVDTTGKTRFVNNRMAAILGYRTEEMLGRLCFDFLDLEEHERALRDFEECKKHDLGPQEYRFRHANGSTVWMDITGTMMVDDAGAFTGILAMCTDVTERKKNEQRLRQTQKLESLGILAGGVAHDFNNLLTGILGNASLAIESTAPGDSQRGMLENVIAASERAAQITRQMLAYAGRDQGRLQLVDLAALARELAPLLTASIPKMVQLSLELESGVSLVQADPAQLQQVMMNIVINAAESIPERTPGAVTVGVGRRRLQLEDYRDAVMPIERNDREFIALSVTDNGSGMDAATQARIFDPFFTTKFDGRGLGLSAVLGIVKGHGGMLTVRTAPGIGSVFTVLLPASPAVPHTAASASAPPAQGARGGTILVVDDEPAVRTVAQRALEQEGYRVLVAGDGQEALDTLKVHPEVRAVVLDMAMPVLSGDMVAPMMRSLRPDLPLILSSGYSERDVMERFEQGVVAAFLEKPYRIAGLVSKVEDVLRGGRGD